MADGYVLGRVFHRGDEIGVGLVGVVGGCRRGGRGEEEVGTRWGDGDRVTEGDFVEVLAEVYRMQAGGEVCVARLIDNPHEGIRGVIVVLALDGIP